MEVDASVQHLLLIAVSGGLDAVSAPPLRLELEAGIHRVPFVVLDLQALDSCSPEAVEIILGAAALARTTAKDLVVIPGPPAVLAVLTQADVDRHLRFTDAP